MVPLAAVPSPGFPDFAGEATLSRGAGEGVALRLQRGDGAVRVGFARRGAQTAVAELYQRTPCRVLFPEPEPGDIAQAVLLTTSGGLAGGDRIAIEVTAAAGATATATTAAAEKVYRSLGPDAQVAVRLTVDEGGLLEWLPQETILFDGARLDRRVSATVAPGGKLLAAECLVFGRIARSETFRSGLLHEGWRVAVADRLVWADALRLEGDVLRHLDAPVGFGGARAIATVVYVAADAAEHLPAARELAEDASCRAGATVVNGVLLARFLDAKPEAVRLAAMRYVAALRHRVAGLPPALPRVWGEIR